MNESKMFTILFVGMLVAFIGGILVGDVFGSIKTQRDFYKAQLEKSEHMLVSKIAITNAYEEGKITQPRNVKN